MRRVLAALFLFAMATSGFGENRVTPLTRAIGDSLYAKLAGGSTIAGTTTFSNVVINGTCAGTGCGGSGTVTSVGAGTIASIFTFSVATATTTPAISLSFSSQLANCILAGPTSGGDAAPTCRAMVAADLPASALVSGGALGTPSSGTLTNATGLPIGGLTGLATGIATFLGSATSANIASAVTDETGTISLMFSNSWTSTGLPIFQNTAAAGTFAVTNTSATFKTYFSSSTSFGQVSVNRTVAGAADDGTKGSVAVNWASGVGTSSFTIFTGATSGTVAQGFSVNESQHVTMEGVTSTGATGTGNQMYSISPSTTGTLNAVAITASSTITPSQTAGIVGTTTNNSANTGSFGEYVTGTTSAATTSLSTGTSVNVGAGTNISLTAGDWDCTGVVNFTLGATTSVTNLSGGVSTTTGTLPAQDSFFDFETAANVMTNTKVAAYVCPTVRLSISGTTSVFLVTQATFTASTITAGGTVRCRRMR